MRRFALFAVLLLVACESPTVTCTVVRTGEILVSDGIYTAETLFDPGAARELGLDDFPQIGGEEFEIEVDREARVLIVRYTKDGKDIEERWSFASSRLEGP